MIVPAMSRMNDKKIVPARPLRAKTLPDGSLEMKADG